jgi:hypothetical protein
MSLMPIVQHAVVSRGGRYLLQRLSTRVPVFTLLTTGQARRQPLSPTTALRAATIHHQTLPLQVRPLQVRPLRNRSHPIATAVRTIARTPMAAERVTPTVLEATLIRQNG